MITPTRRELLKYMAQGLGGVAAAAAIPGSAQAFFKGGGSFPAASSPAIPAAAASYGFNTLTFYDDFNSLSTIDVNNTMQPGYKWYVQSLVLGTYPTNTLIAFAPSSFSVASSILTYTPNTPVGDPNSGGNIYCAGFKSDNTFVGNTIAPTGWYAECRMSYDPSKVSGNWFPAFWMWDKSIMLNSATNTAYGTHRYSEFDIFESYGTSGTGYVDWDWSSPSTQVSNTNSNLGVPSPVDSGFHKYGLLWVPQAKNGGTGLIQRYIDGVHYPAGDVTYSSSTISSNATTGATTGWMSGADASTQGFTVQLQTGSNCPINVDYVQIWQ